MPLYNRRSMYKRNPEIGADNFQIPDESTWDIGSGEAAVKKPKLFPDTNKSNTGINNNNAQPQVEYKPAPMKEGMADSDPIDAIQAPKHPKDSTGKTILKSSLQVLLPALLGGLSGDGALAGGTVGAMNVAGDLLGKSDRDYVRDRAEFEKDREYGQGERKNMADTEYKRKLLGVSERNATSTASNAASNRIRALKDTNKNVVPPDVLAAKNAIDHYKNADPATITPEATAAYKRQKNKLLLWQMSKKVDPLDYEDYNANLPIAPIAE